MSTNDPIVALEELQKKYLDLLHSTEYTKGKQLLHFKTNLKQLRLNNLFKRARKYRIEKIVISKLAKADKSLFYNPGEYPLTPVHAVVYSCITGGYDQIKDPLLLTGNTDYVCFTDSTEILSSVWNFKNIPTIDSGDSRVDLRRVNRYCKMHPHKLFDGYDYAIYIDGNVQIVSDISGLFNIAKKSKTGIAMHLHSRRDCVYKEAEACNYYKRGNLEKIDKFIEHIRASGFPEGFGLLECTIIVVDLKNTLGKELFSAWWQELNQTGVGRDQLVLPYVLWKMGLTIEDIGILGNNEYYNPKFLISSHN